LHGFPLYLELYSVFCLIILIGKNLIKRNIIDFIFFLVYYFKVFGKKVIF